MKKWNYVKNYKTILNKQMKNLKKIDKNYKNLKLQ